MQDPNIFGAKFSGKSMFLGLNFTLHTHTPVYKYIRSTPYPPPPPPPSRRTEHLKFMDILQFLSPGYNLKSFSKHLVFQNENCFPYDYFTHADQLDETTLPPYETFCSIIKGCDVLEEDAAFQQLLDQEKSEQEPLQSLRLPAKPKTGPENYQWLQHLWTENQWSTFADFLKWYNDLDVTPTIQATNELYKNIRIDFIHHAISIPVVAMMVCFNSSYFDPHFIPRRGGGGSSGPPTISSTFDCTNLKFCKRYPSRSQKVQGL